MIREAIDKVVQKINLTQTEMTQVVEEIMTGNATPIQIGAFITALRMKGETVDEITAAAKVMRAKAASIPLEKGVDVVDTCGTGGDVSHTFNISTATAFVLAGCGVKVAKHGNRSVSSKCGSADVLEELGVKIDLSPDRVKACIEKIGIGFMFAPIFHSAMKHAVAPRKEIGIRTIFNILGPLSNPASATHQVLGTFKPELTEPMAGVLSNLGVKAAMIVHSEDGLDEISISGKTKITELKNKAIKSYTVEPKDFGLKVQDISKVKGGTKSENAKITSGLLEGQKGPARDIVLMNASAALVVLGKAKDFKDGVKLAEDSIDSKKALKKLELLKQEK